MRIKDNIIFGLIITILWSAKTHANKPGETLNPGRNYSGQPKKRDMVMEINPALIDPKNVIIHPAATNYVQESSHHNTIINSPTVSTAVNKNNNGTP